MTEKIMAQLKTRYKNLGLSDKILEVYARKLARTVKEEQEIESAVENVEEDLQIFQSYEDKIRSLKSSFEKEKEKPKPQELEETTKSQEGNNAMDSVLKAIAGLTQEIQGIKQEKVKETNFNLLTQKLDALKVDKKFYESFVNRVDIEKIEDFDVYAQEIKGIEDHLRQSLSNSTLSHGAGTPNNGESKPEKLSVDVEGFINQNFKNERN